MRIKTKGRFNFNIYCETINNSNKLYNIDSKKRGKSNHNSIKKKNSNVDK